MPTHGIWQHVSTTFTFIFVVLLRSLFLFIFARHAGFVGMAFIDQRQIICIARIIQPSTR